jgi:hypothetical protein
MTEFGQCGSKTKTWNCQGVMQPLHENGMGIKQIAKECGVGIGTVYSVI